MFKALLYVLLGQALSSFASQDYFKEKLREGLTLFPLKENVEFAVIPFESDRLLGDDLCDLDEKVRLGQTIKRRGKQKVFISERLVELARKNKTQFPCFHGTFEKVLLATILHEMAHVRDNVEKISIDPDFQRIMGVKKVSSSGRNKVLNQNISASPDPYEFKNLQEALATNVEYLILDPEYECRRPATANFLSRRLGIPLKGECRISYQVPVQSSYLEDNYLVRQEARF